jgi:hypothetical protein
MTLQGRGHERKVSRAASCWRLARWSVAAMIALAAGALVRPAWAYCRTTTCPTCPYDDNGCPSGVPIGWPTSCVTYALQYAASKQIDLSAATAVVEKSFAVWQEASCSNGGPAAVRVDHRFGTAACTLHEYNQTDANANIIMFRDDRWPYEGSGNVLGLTTVTYSRKTGAIFDVDMEINATHHLSVEDEVSPTAYDLQSIVTHEAGHFLGLAHSTIRTATMWPQYTSGSQSFRLLDPDDAEGICAIFSPGAAAQCDATPRQGFSPECGIFPSGEGGKCTLGRGGLSAPGDGGHGWLALACGLGAMGVARRRARRDQTEAR